MSGISVIFMSITSYQTVNHTGKKDGTRMNGIYVETVGRNLDCNKKKENMQ
jgi:hypothetical protein